jgi:hypothetical protein
LIFSCVAFDESLLIAQVELDNKLFAPARKGGRHRRDAAVEVGIDVVNPCFVVCADVEAVARPQDGDASVDVIYMSGGDSPNEALLVDMDDILPCSVPCVRVDRVELDRVLSQTRVEANAGRSESLYLGEPLDCGCYLFLIITHSSVERLAHEARARLFARFKPVDHQREELGVQQMEKHECACAKRQAAFICVSSEWVDSGFNI